MAEGFSCGRCMAQSDGNVVGWALCSASGNTFLRCPKCWARVLNCAPNLYAAVTVWALNGERAPLLDVLAMIDGPGEKAVARG